MTEQQPVDRIRTAAAALVVVALAVRVSLWSYTSDDVVYFFGPWREALREAGAWDGLALDVSDYTPPYLYALALTTLLPIDALHAVKLMALATDALLLLSVLLLLRQRGLAAPRVLVGTAAVALTPTVVVNGALWGQSDAGWLGLAVAGLACAAAGRPWWAMALTGVSLAVKLQAGFLVPVLVVLVVTRAVPIRAVLAVPVGYLVMFLPALGAGAPPSVLYAAYVEQAGEYPAMTLNAPNLWQLLPDRPDILALPATVATVVLVLLTVAVVARLRPPEDAVALVRTALLFALLCPFFLPHMHERYFFAADVLAVLYAVVQRGRWAVPLLVVSASLLSYVPYLARTAPVVPFPVLTLTMALALGVVARDLARSGRTA